MRNPFLRFLTLAALCLHCSCGGTSGAQQPAFQLISPFDDGENGTRTVSATAVITTNNGSQPLLMIQGRVINDVNNGLIFYKVKNGYYDSGTVPYPVIVSGGGAFDIFLNDPLRNPVTPLEQEADNLFTLQATNRFSPIGKDGSPVPVEAYVTIKVRNGIKFDSPAYAKIDPDGTVNSGCVFNAASSGTVPETQGIRGVFSNPDYVSNPVLYRADAADLVAPVDPESPVGDAVPFTFNVSDGTFSITFDSSSFAAAGFTGGASADNNFYIVFDSSDPAQLPATGAIATVPFLDCNVTAP